MILRVLGILVVAYVLGFVLFMLALGRPLDAATVTDAIVVPTGGPGRIDRGLALLGEDAARRMLVSGVGTDVRAADLARTYRVPRRRFDCCVDLGREAIDTRSNAEETARWVEAHRYRSVRLVTSDWHMPRARLELAHALGGDVELVGDGVPSNPRLSSLVGEYNKFLIRRVALWVGR